MKNKGVVHAVNDIKSILKIVLDEENGCNEGSLTDDLYEGIVRRLELILNYVDDLYEVYDIKDVF